MVEGEKEEDQLVSGRKGCSSSLPRSKRLPSESSEKEAKERALPLLIRVSSKVERREKMRFPKLKAYRVSRPPPPLSPFLHWIGRFSLAFLNKFVLSKTKGEHLILRISFEARVY